MPATSLPLINLYCCSSPASRRQSCVKVDVQFRSPSPASWSSSARSPLQACHQHARRLETTVSRRVPKL
ncbi:hypothetical protein NDU88_000772 [Pleurodeles waltl]|uniref:Uncharacterized protein n=1 Tax=Pleurodeles waltl TaxID=8319 RepID=A0AAV7UST9_PLEWA|nr:hypothetical protein NDU88_000772 [Pleurodeles waltl]